MQNEYTIGGTHNFSQELSNLPYLEEDEDSVSYDVEPQFTNIPVKETINYIRDSGIQSKSDSIQMLWVPQKMSPK